jgi:subtilase family serine protease
LPASHGLGVNGLASTPYNVAVGGTQFDDTAAPSAYWNNSNDGYTASARSYIPEAAWNESSYMSGSGGNGLFAGSGGVSQVYATPAWQTGKGVPAGDPGATAQHHRYLPDVSLAAAGHEGYLVVREGGLYLVGGTSASAPAFAGLAAILAQYTGGRNGNLNTRLYSLAAQTPGAYHDVTSGSTAVPCAGASAGCGSTTAGTVGVINGYDAGAGYDLATGLGSVDAYAMALNWGARPATAPSISALNPDPMTASSTAQTLTITGSNFAAGAKVQASYAGGPATNLTVNTVGPGQITASVVTGVATRVWSIVVTNPNGQSSFAGSLQVTAPTTPPAIGSLNPNPMTGANGGQVLAINGSGFQSGAGLKVSLTYAGGSVTTVSGGQILFIDSGQILALVNVGTAARMWSVTVTNPNGMESNGASLSVTAPPQVVKGNLGTQ